MSEVDKKNYYQKLREYCINRKLTNTTIGATTIAPKLKKVTGVIVRKVTEFLAGGSVDVIVDGVENIPKEPVIFGCTHQGILDNFVWIADCPKHCLILHVAHIHIRYGERITVSEQDELAVKLAEYKEKISTIRWSLIEEKGLYKRNEIDNPMQSINQI